jgi:energy-converting hydrogenase Eha subunit A
MSNINLLVEQTLLFEAASKAELTKLASNDKVKKFIGISKEYITNNGKISPMKLKESNSLLQDPKVQAYIEATQQVAVRDSWLISILGIAPISGIIASGFAVIGGASLGLSLIIGAIGAVLIGILSGEVLSSIAKVFAKWEAENKVLKNVPGGMRTHF